MASGRTRDEVTATGWPAVDYEELPWVPRLDEPPASRTERRKRQGPYRAAVVAPIATAALTLPSGVAALVDDATTEITRFDAEMGPAVTPFAAILLRSESAASSRIEHLTASARAIAEAEIGVSGRRNAAEIVANTRTMTAALSLADRLDADSILQMHSALMRVVAPAAGTWRAEQVWIGGGFLGPQDADFVPPHHSRVRASIDDLVAFLDRDDLPVLAQVALAHAQFETIHPFTDGNGRTGRALAQAMLLGKRLTRSVTVPISAGLLADTESYVAALTSYRAGDPLTIVEQFAQASFRAVGNGRVLVSELRAVREEWRGAVTARRDAAVWRVLDLVLRRPVLTAQVVADELGVLPGNAARVVAPLLDAGILVQSAGRRNQVWRSPEVLSALDAFAARAGRRTPAW